jgi:hypothetical protein
MKGIAEFGFRCRKTALLVLASALLVGCATTDDCRHPLLEHCHKPVKKGPLTVTVTGLVKFPGVHVIPLGGLRLKDAVALAGGDLPDEFFSGTKPAQVLVSIERLEGTYHFSLPLVTKDFAGRVFLQPNDKVSLQPYTITGLARAAYRGVGDKDIAEALDLQTWKEILHREDVGVQTLSYDVVFRDVTVPERVVTVTLRGTGKRELLPTRSLARRAAPSAPLTTGPPAPAAVVLAPVREVLQPMVLPVALQLKPTPAATRSNDGDPLATLASFSEDIQTSAHEMTVIVLHRVVDGKSNEYILLRAGSKASYPDRAIAQKVLESTFVIPGDSVAIDILPRIPIVLSSLVAPQLFDFAAGPAPVPSKCKQELESLKQTFVRPITNTCKNVGDLVRPTLESIPAAVSAQLPR